MQDDRQRREFVDGIRLGVDGLRAPQSMLLDRVRPKRRRTPWKVAKARIREIERLIQARHGFNIPHTDDADQYIWIVANHMAEFSLDLARDLLGWCNRWAPHFEREELSDLAKRVPKPPLKFRADTIARELGVKYAEREAVGLKTIGAIDVNAEQRQAIAAERRRRRDRERADRQRRASGRLTRAEYEATSLSRTQPWVQEGVSRRTWYRSQRRKWVT